MLKACSILVFLVALAIPAASQSEANLLAEKAFVEADAQLNATYSEFLNSIRERQVRESLREAQRAWLVFRDKEASARASLSAGGGSAYATDYLANLAELTKERSAQLRKMRRLAP